MSLGGFLAAKIVFNFGMATDPTFDSAADLSSRHSLRGRDPMHEAVE
jgi:hypothetical protein